jgi:hypothetical protein
VVEVVREPGSVEENLQCLVLVNYPFGCLQA